MCLNFVSEYTRQLTNNQLIVDMRIYWPFLFLSLAAHAAWAGTSNVINPIVDLGYEVYGGYYNSTSQLNIFKGHVNSATRHPLG